MSIPPSAKKLFPSLQVDGDVAAFGIADLKKLLPSLEIVANASEEGMLEL